MMKHYDIAVIGSGGGSKISSPASKLGYQVALIEKGPLGGTCLNRGCIPSKMLIHAAEVVEQIQEAPQYQVYPQGYEVDFQALVQRVSQEIDEESLSINPILEAKANLDWYRDHACFVDNHTLQVGEETITADKIFIAAGARPHIPPVPGLAQTPYLTSTEALRLTQLPKVMVVLGGGYIATELAYFFKKMGVEVHMLVRSTLLKFEDTDIREELTREFSKDCHLYAPSQLHQVSYQGEQFHIEFTHEDTKQTLQADQLLVATGVRPNTDQLGLENTDVQINDQGFIQTNKFLETNAANVWAFGDITGRHMFRHSANYQGEYLQETIIHGEPKYPIDEWPTPYAVFTHPQIAGVGHSEQELQQQSYDYVVGKNKYAQSAMGMALRSNHGFVKLMVERKTRKLLGCRIIGHEASVLIHQVIPLIRLEKRLDDILEMIHIHPALSELIRNAARKARDELVKAGDDIPIRLQIK